MAVFIAQEECTVNVGKAWHYLLIHPEKGYYTGYKGREAFGDLESARIYRTEQEAHMARLRAGMEVRVESCLLWHSSKGANSTANTTAPMDKTTTSINNSTFTQNKLTQNKPIPHDQPGHGFRVINGLLPDQCDMAHQLANRRDNRVNKKNTQLRLVKSS